MPRWLPPQPGTEGGACICVCVCLFEGLEGLLVVVAAGSEKGAGGRVGGFPSFIKTLLCEHCVSPHPGCMQSHPEADRQITFKHANEKSLLELSEVHIRMCACVFLLFIQRFVTLSHCLTAGEI